MSDIELEDIVARFEAEFVSGNKPEIRDFLPGDGGDNILIELLHTDLEIRIKNGQKKRVENYIE